jgi:hypothetical protein
MGLSVTFIRCVFSPPDLCVTQCTSTNASCYLTLFPRIIERAVLSSVASAVSRPWL